MELQEVTIVLLAIGAIGGYQIFRYLKKEKQEVPVRKKIQAYQQSGQPLMREEEVPLNSEEKTRIRTRQVWLSIGMVLMMEAILIGLACILIFSIKLNNYLVLTGLFMLSVGCIYLIVRSNARQKRDVENGNKTIIRGIVTKKHNDGDENTSYYLIIDKVELLVKKSVYNAYRIGDAVEFHLFKPYYNMVLHHKKLPGAGLSDS